MASLACDLRSMDVQLIALTQAGKVVVLPCQDLANLRDAAQRKVECGEWRTWDAFEAPSDERRSRKLVASHTPGRQSQNT
jgi:hypothetical protein